MIHRVCVFILLSGIIFACQKDPQITKSLFEQPSIEGKFSYLASPFLTAGDRVYMVGHQNGSFPELGWHITGEMGGIWNHPIKLMDGFDIRLMSNEDTLTLDRAQNFINYPMANKHVFKWEEKSITAERWQFVPDGEQGMIIQLVLKNNGEIPQNVSVLFTGNTDLRPTWLGERTNMIDGKDLAEYDKINDYWLMKDEKNEWYTLFGADASSNEAFSSQSTYLGNGTAGNLSYIVPLKKGEQKKITFCIAGSYKNKDSAIRSYSKILNHWDSMFADKKNRYEELANLSKLTTSDSLLNQTFEWLKYNCDWLIRDVPEVGRGIAAGIPDYPWWFGVDSEYALQGYMAIGQHDIVHSSIALLDSVSGAVNGNGRIIHEMSTNGAVFNPGNINETPQFASLIWEIFQWNGDLAFLEKYYPTVQKGLDWLMEKRDENRNLFPDGFGMMEIHGMDSEMIDVASYTQKGAADAAKMAEILGKNGDFSRFQELANKLKSKINEEFWSEEFNSYADFIGNDNQALSLIEDAIIRADTLNKPWAVEELIQTRKKIKKNPSSKLKPFVLHHNWVVNTPMEVGIADPSKAAQALKTAKNYTNPFGMFVTGIDRDESAGSDDGSFQGSKVFSYTGAVMTLPTSVQAIAECKYGNPDAALDYIKRMTKSFSYALPGSLYEVSPDYGMMTQAWNIYGFAIPIVKYFFGINPMAYRKEMLFSPLMPSKWSNVSLENVHVKDNSYHISYHKDGNHISWTIEQSNPAWTVRIPKAILGKNYQLIGEVSGENESDILLSGLKIKLNLN